MHDATDRPASHTREDVIEVARILHELCADRGLSDSQACRPPGCEPSLLRAGVRASFAQAPAPAPALGVFLQVSEDTEGGGCD